MRSPKIFTFQSVRLAALMCVCTLSLMSCSESSSSGDDQVVNESIADTVDIDNETSIQDSNADDVNQEADELVVDSDSETNQLEQTADSSTSGSVDTLSGGNSAGEVDAPQPVRVGLVLVPDKTFRIAW